jgi:hypothetical protein
MLNSKQHLTISNEIESSSNDEEEAPSSQKDTVKITERGPEFSFFKEESLSNN